MVEGKDNLKEKLKQKLREIFQFENEDLDFGIHRIMKYKRKEIEKFIEKELIEEIGKQLELMSKEERKKIEKKLKEISSKNGVKKYLEALKKGDEERARIYREDFKEQIEEYERLKKQLEEIRISEELEKEIYNHLINFFSRYYDNGDFISKRRYGKNEKYVVPYNGEEVLLYWANKDQYYIKTTEYFRRYTFNIKELTVNFRVVEAEEEKGNIKSSEKKFFVLNKKMFDLDDEKNVLNIYFEYRVVNKEEAKKHNWGDKDGKGIKQEKINEEIVQILQEKIPKNNLARLIFEKDPKSKTGKTYIEKHLYNYTRGNTTDYFIHKDLKGFLERELDFYIKNEFLQLEDLQVLEESGYFDKLRLYLIGVRAFRKIALKIIEFLAQIENFQKKLWEKKKFVIDTHYVITLDKIKEYAGEEFLESILEEILRNEKQIKEWKELFGIEVKRKEDFIADNTLNEKEWKKLPIDTKYFDEEFKWKLLEALTKEKDLDEILDGVLIKSENWQALNLLLRKYKNKIQAIYIDPPYNTGNDDFLYKDKYQHSSWLTMMENRLELAKELMKEDGIIFLSINDIELFNLKKLLEFVFKNFVSLISWERSTSPESLGQKAATISKTLEYLLVFSKTKKIPQFKDVSITIPRIYFLEILKKSGYNYYLKLSLDNDEAWSKINEKDNLKVFKFKSDFKYENISKLPIDELIKKAKEGKIFTLNRPQKGYTTLNEFIKYAKTNDLIKIEYKDRDGEKKIVYIYGGKTQKTSKGGRTLIFYKNFIGYLPNEKKVIIRHPFTDFLSKEMVNIVNLRHEKNEIDIKGQKPEGLLKLIIASTTNERDLILDFFLGSGTTTAVAHKLKRKWIGVEMGEHFYTVVLPRMKKVLAYDKSGISKEKDVKEKYNEKTAGGFFKYHTLEQYEDTIENIKFDDVMGRKASELLPDYIFYMLEWETKSSKTFFNLDKVKDPFNYKLQIIENYPRKTVNVDLIETFNYLLGLNISRYKVLRDNGRKYVFVFGEKDGKRIAIVWRNVKDIDLEKDKGIVESNIQDFNPDEIYINGDAVVKNFKPIEPLFKSLMFEKVE